MAIEATFIKVTDYGEITDGRAYQIKGMSYRINELFGKYHLDAAKKVEGGQFINFYLSPFVFSIKQSCEEIKEIFLLRMKEWSSKQKIRKEEHMS